MRPEVSDSDIFVLIISMIGPEDSECTDYEEVNFQKDLRKLVKARSRRIVYQGRMDGIISRGRAQ